MKPSNPNTRFSRIVIGGGLFGCFSAITLADRGHEVLLIEQDPDLMQRASFVNQARLHTGFHYPRSILTANEARKNYRRFRANWPDAVRDFVHIYGVAKYNSKTSGNDFKAFFSRIGASAEEIDPDRWFHAQTVSRAFKVEEPSFDANMLRRQMYEEIRSRKRIHLRLNSAVEGGFANDSRVGILTNSNELFEAEQIVLATYAGTNSVRKTLGLSALPLSFELAEVVIGSVSSELRDFGFTVMDGPFWSLMPFGHSNNVSLTSVGMTPRLKSSVEPTFSCQNERSACRALHLRSCSNCLVRPKSAVIHMKQQMASFLKQASDFSSSHSIYTVKAKLKSTFVDDARPTVVFRELDSNVVTVFSGKISSVFDLEEQLV